MNSQASTILLKTIDQLFYQIEKTSLAAHKVIEQPILPNDNKSLVSEIVLRYFDEIQKNIIQIFSMMLSSSNLWKSFFPDLKKNIEANNPEFAFDGIAIIRKEYAHKLERFYEISELLQEYLHQLKRFSLSKDDLNFKNYQFFILKIEELLQIINALNNSWEHWVTSFDLENTKLLAEIEDKHFVWLEIHHRIRTNQLNIKKTNHDHY
ncbi:hypothetical protein ABW636_16825 [Aquimarina sp. 2201CG1-2-11]|uniref:hypothetical protein n=1 Tax=Aquimarina discodermiae TaxID=3231043 RepID=UPI003463429C